MNKDEQIQHLREQLARVEGERDAYKAMTTRRHEVVTAPYTPRPYVWPTYGYMCASCGQWATAGHTCWRWGTQTAWPYAQTYTVAASTYPDAQQTVSLTAQSYPVLAKIWDNPSDDIFDNIGADGGESNE